MAVKTRADILTAIATLFADNTNGDISAEDLRSICNDLADSSVNSSTDTASTGLSAYDTSRVYYSGNIVQYDYKWYVANTTTTPGAFNSAQWTFQGYIQYSGSLAIPTASVLTLNGTPLTLVAAIASRTIRVSNVRATITYNSVAYATNTQLDIYMSVGGATNVQFTIPSLLAAVANQHRVGTITAAAQLAENTALMVRVNSGNPTAGNSDIVVYFNYEVV
jgi:hypothetical protein